MADTNNEVLINTVIDFDWQKNRKKLDDLDKRLRDLQNQKEINIKVRGEAFQKLVEINKQIQEETQKLQGMSGKLGHGNEESLKQQQKLLKDLTAQADAYQKQITGADFQNLKVEYKMSYYQEMMRQTAAELVNVTYTTEEAVKKSIDRIQAKLIKLTEKKSENMAYRQGLYQQIQDTQAALAREEQVLSQMKPSLIPSQAAEMEAQKTKVADLAATLAKLERQYQGTATADTKLRAEIAASQDQLSGLVDQYQKMASTMEQTPEATEKGAEGVEKMNQALKQTPEAADKSTAALEKVGEATAKTAEHAERSANAIQHFGNRIAGLIKRVFVFSLITRGLRQVRTWFTNVLKTNDEANAAMARLKAAVLAFIQPLVQTVIPVLTKIMNLLTVMFYYAGKTLAAIFGFDYGSMVGNAQALYDSTSGTADSLGKATDNAKKLKRELMSFDNLEILQDDDDDKSSVADIGADAGGAVKPNWNFKDILTDQLKEIAFLTAEGLIAVGLVLTFSGVAPGVGLAMIVFGAAILYGELKENWDYIKTMLQGPLGNVLAILGGAAVIVGLLCIALGKPGVGLGLIAAGATLIAPVVMAHWDNLQEMMEGPIGTALKAMSLAMVAIGLIMLFIPGKQLLGVGLILGGIAVYRFLCGVQEQGLGNTSSIQTTLEGPIGTLLKDLAIGMALIGLIMLFIPGKQPLGIGLLATGIAAYIAITQAQEQSLNSTGTLSGMLYSSIRTVLYGLAIAAALAGIMLLFIPGKLPLGIGLIIAGIAVFCGVYGAKDMDLSDTSSIRGNLYKVIRSTIVGLAIGLSLVGFVMLFVPGKQPVGIGLLVAGIATYMAVNSVSEQELSGTGTLSGTLYKAIRTVLYGVSLGLALVGLLMLFIPGKQMFGVGMLTAGLGTYIALHGVKEGKFDASKILEELEGPMGTVLKGLSVAITIVGVILMFTAHPVVGAIMAGAGLLAYAGIKSIENMDGPISGEKLLNDLQAQLEPFLVLGGTAMMVVGLICIFLGDDFHGLPLFFAGASMLFGISYGNENLEEESQVWSNAMAAVKEAEQEYIYGLDATVDEAGRIVREGADGTVEDVGLSMEDLKTLTAATGGQVSDDFDSMLSSLALSANMNKGEFLGYIQELVKEAKEQGVDATSYIAEQLWGLDITAGTTADNIQDDATVTASVVVDKHQKVGASAKTTADGMESDMKRSFLGIQTDAKKKFSEGSGSVPDLIKGGMATGLAAAIVASGEIKTKAIDPIAEEADKKLGGQGSDLVTSVKAGADASVDEWENKDDEFGDAIVPIDDVFTATFGENGSLALKFATVWDILCNIVKASVLSMKQAIEGSGIKDAMVMQFSDNAEAINRTFGGAASAAGANAGSGVIATVTRLFDNIVAAIQNGIDSIRNALSNLNLAGELANQFSGYGSIANTVDNFFYNVKVSVVSSLNSILSYVESAMGSINYGLVSITNNLNRVASQAASINRGSYYTSYGSFSYPYLSRLSYPAYAQGTVVPPNSAHLAIVGDNKKEPEVISPLSTMEEAFVRALEKCGLGNGLNANVYIDGKQTAEAVTKWQNRMNRAYGLM